MKLKGILIVSFLLGMTAQAYKKPRDLEQGMKMMNSRLKQISQGLQIGTAPQKLSGVAQEFADIIIDTKSFIPEKVDEAPTGEQANLKNLYESMMDDASALGGKLAEHLKNGDKDNALKIIGRLKSTRKEGHAEFRGQESQPMGMYQMDLALPADLKTTMKIVGNDVKTISTQINDATKNISSISLALEVAELLRHSKTFTPKTIADAPVSDRASLTVKYHQMIDDAVKVATDLSDAIRGNNPVLAKSLVDQLLQIKKDSHLEFK